MTQEQALQKKIDELEKNFEEVCTLLHNLIITTENRKIYGDDFIDLEIKETKLDFRNIVEAIDKGDGE